MTGNIVWRISCRKTVRTRSDCCKLLTKGRSSTSKNFFRVIFETCSPLSLCSPTLVSNPRSSGEYRNARAMNAKNSSTLEVYEADGKSMYLKSSQSVGTGAHHSCSSRFVSAATRRTAADFPDPEGPVISMILEAPGCSLFDIHSRIESNFFLATTMSASDLEGIFVRWRFLEINTIKWSSKGSRNDHGSPWRMLYEPQMRMDSRDVAFHKPACGCALWHCHFARINSLQSTGPRSKSSPKAQDPDDVRSPCRKSFSKANDVFGENQDVWGFSATTWREAHIYERLKVRRYEGTVRYCS